MKFHPQFVDIYPEEKKAMSFTITSLITSAISAAKAATQKREPARLEGKSSEKAEEMLTQLLEHNNLTMVDNKTGRPLAGIDGPYRYQGPDIDGDGDITEFLTFSETVGYKLFAEAVMGAHARRTGNKALEDKCYRNFERVWNWAFENMVRRNIGKVYDYGKKEWVPVPEGKRDSLLAWRYIDTIDESGRGGIIYYKRGREGDGRWIDGIDGAPDGDQFTAVALYIASKLWADRTQKHAYLENARNIVCDMRLKYIKNIGGRNYLMGGDEFHAVNGLNPSYSFEAAYENIFPELDPEGKAVWRSLIQTSYYAAVNGADCTMHTSLNEAVTGSVNLPPNWISVSDDHSFSDMPWANDLDWISGWDGMRTLAMKAWHSEVNPESELARRYLTDNTGTVEDFGPYSFIKRTFKNEGKIQVGFGIDGSTRHVDVLQDSADFQNVFAWGVHLAYFSSAGDGEMAEAMFGKIAEHYVGDLNGNGVIEDCEGTFYAGKEELLNAARQNQNRLDRNGNPMTDNEPIITPGVEVDGSVFGKEGKVIIAKYDYFGSYWAWFGLATATGWIGDALTMQETGN